MSSAPEVERQRVAVHEIFLDQENPRHDPQSSQAAAIELLCKDDQILRLARDIAKHGLSPLEALALIEHRDAKTDELRGYIVYEGNRRICAIKLLNDSDLAPSGIRREIDKLSKDYEPITHVEAPVFESKEEVSLWVERLHGGAQDGVGRKVWTADQKARFTGRSPNTVALAVLDYAEREGLITKAEREGKLSTAQRFLSNPVFRHALGADTGGPDGPVRTRSEEDFRVMVSRFISDLKRGPAGPVNSRTNAQDHREYAERILAEEQHSNTYGFSEPIDETGKQSGSKPNTPKPPTKRRRIVTDRELSKALGASGSYKLERLYHSVCAIDALTHTPLLSVGVWSMVESLSRLAGSKTDFQAFFTPQRLATLGLGDKKQTTSVRNALRRISENGNSTKHDQTSANFNGEQLINDVETITPLLMATAKEVAIQKA